MRLMAGYVLGLMMDNVLSSISPMTTMATLGREFAHGAQKSMSCCHWIWIQRPDLCPLENCKVQRLPPVVLLSMTYIIKL